VLKYLALRDSFGDLYCQRIDVGLLTSISTSRRLMVHAAVSIGLVRTPTFGWQAETRLHLLTTCSPTTKSFEIEGVEVIGPNTGGTARDKIKSVRLIIDGKENEMITFNELNAPALIGAEKITPMMFRDGSQCVNLGRGILAPGGLARGTAPWSCCPKVGPGEKLGIEVTFASAAENGGTSTAINTDMRVRVHYCKVKGENKLLEILARNGFLDNANGVVQEFDVGDFEVSELMPIQPVTKRVPENWCVQARGLDQAPRRQ